MAAQGNNLTKQEARNSIYSNKRETQEKRINVVNDIKFFAKHEKLI